MKSKLPVLTATLLLAVGAVAGYRGTEPQEHSDGPSRATAPAAGSASTSAQAGEAIAPIPPTAGDQLIRDARTQLERRASVTARLRQQVQLRGRKLRGIGGYWQQGGGDELLARLELQIVGESSSLLQVCTGRFLWTDSKYPTGRTVTRLDLGKLRNEATRSTDGFDGLDLGPSSWPQAPPNLSLQAGGLSSLLTALADSFAFSPPQSMRWTPNPALEGLPESIPVFAVVGHWQPQALAAIEPQALGAIEPKLKDANLAVHSRRLASLPEQLPQEVLVLFGQSDLFPYRIEFRNRLSLLPAAGGQFPPIQLNRDPLVCLEFESVTFNLSIAAGQFDYLPGDARFDDNTAKQLEKLRLKREEKVAARRREQQ